MNLRVKIKRLHDAAVIPQYAREGDAGFDLVAVEDTVIEPGETKIVPTGIAVSLPPGYEAQIRPRSGITVKTKLRVQLGTIDSGYVGEIGVIVDNISQMKYNVEDSGEWHGDERIEDLRLDVDTDYVVNTANAETTVVRGYHPVGTYLIEKGTRIAQAVIAPVEQAVFTEVDDLGETARGNKGYGSSGVKADG
jgi:dUTP pyrophosphatase